MMIPFYSYYITILLTVYLHMYISIYIYITPKKNSIIYILLYIVNTLPELKYMYV